MLGTLFFPKTLLQVHISLVIANNKEYWKSKQRNIGFKLF